MATITAAAGGGNWTAGGSWVGGVAPTAADDVLLTGTSGTITIDSGAVCRSINLTGYTGTVTHTSGVTLTIGDATAGLANVALEFPASGWTYTLGNTSTSALSFVSTSATQQTVNFNGITTANVTYNAASNGSWKLTGTHNTGSNSTVTLTKGSLDVNSQTMSVGRFTITGTVTRSLTLGTASITIKVSSTGLGGWNLTDPTALTFSGASSTITLTGSDAFFAGGGLTYGTVIFQTGTSSSRTTGTNTFSTYTVTQPASTPPYVHIVFANQTITGVLTFTGNSSIVRILVTSDIIGTSRTLTAASVVAQHVDFRDIVGAGASSWNLAAITGNSGDCGGNSSITFTTPSTQTWSGTAGGNWSTNAWTSRVPLPQDDVVISSAFSASQTVTLDMPRAGKSISWVGATGTPAWAMGTSTTIYGSVTKILGMTHSGAASATFEGRGAFTLTNAGITWTNPIIIAMFGGTLTISGTFLSTSTCTVNNGTFNDGGNSVTFTTFTSTGALTRVVTLTGTLTLTSTGTVFNVTSSGLTFNGAGSTIIISEATQGTSKTFAGGGVTTYGNITFSGKNIIVTGANTFAIMALNNLGDTTGVTLPASTTTTISGLTSTASSGNLAKLISSVSGTAATLSKSSGTVSVDYVSIKDSTVTGGASWYAGANSTNVSGNTGWVFTAVPLLFLSRCVPRGIFRGVLRFLTWFFFV